MLTRFATPRVVNRDGSRKTFFLEKRFIYRSKSLNNGMEADHSKLKGLIKPVLGCEFMKPAYTPNKGVEIKGMFGKEQPEFWMYDQGTWQRSGLFYDNFLSIQQLD